MDATKNELGYFKVKRKEKLNDTENNVHLLICKFIFLENNISFNLIKMGPAILV